MTASSPVLRLAFNGKFLSAVPTGVHRVAEQMIVGLDRMMEQEPELRARVDAVVLAPRDVRRQLVTKHIPTHYMGPLNWQFWEQIELPLRLDGRFLVNLCNLGPVMTRSAVTMVHDAQVYLTPGSYSFAFRFFYKIAQPLIGRRHRRVLTVSNFSKEQLVHFGVASPDRIHVIHNGVDHTSATSGGSGTVPELEISDRRYVLALANLQRHKNIRVLLRAFTDPRLADKKLVLFGRADKKAFEAQGIDVPANVMFAGSVSDAQLRALMKDALCFAFPSTTEGFGLPPLEAMLLGCPAVVAPCGALPEVCGDAALIADPNDAAAWAAAFHSLSTDETLWKKYSTAGQVRARSFTWERSVKELLRVLEEQCKVSFPALVPVKNDA